MSHFMDYGNTEHGIQPPALTIQLINECRTALRTAGITHKEAAHRLGITPKHLSQMLVGHAQLGLEWADMIAAMCGRRFRVTSEEVAPTTSPTR